MWDYLWSKSYGSDQFSVLKPSEKGRDSLRGGKVTLIGDNKLHLSLPQRHVCDQLSLKMKIKDSAGEIFLEHVYPTIHAIPKR